MNIHVTDGSVSEIQADILVLFARKEKKTDTLVLTAGGATVDTRFKSRLTALAGAEHFEATAGKTFVVHANGEIAAGRVMIVGVPHDPEALDILEIGAAIGKRAKGSFARTVAVLLEDEGGFFKPFPSSRTAQLLVDGLRLSTYVFLNHKNEDEKKKNHEIESVAFIAPKALHGQLSSGIKRGQLESDAVCFTRDLVNEPPSLTTPSYLASVALEMARKDSAVRCTVLDRSEMEKLGMGGLLGIARGSDEEPKFVHLSYDGGGKKTIALVGKGITFDTGGLSLKPPQSMETMKLDMSGAAAVLGVFSVLSKLRPKVRVEGLLCITENMPSGKAVKPGDVVSIMNGKTVEILNTDAEGRMVLADGLSYAVEKVKPDVIIDLATLTGACMVALGEDIAGMFSNNAPLAKALLSEASESGERLWELPLAKEYKAAIKSTVADIKNISSSRYGGAINGALFLQEFVPDAFPWAHLDIAGPAFAEKEMPLTPYGGTGYGVRLLLSYLMSV